jgi:hypothetical protein
MKYSIFFFLCLTLNSFAQKKTTSTFDINSTLFLKNVNLDDGKEYEINSLVGFPNNVREKNWYEISLENKYPKTPIVIKSFENEISNLKILSKYAVDNLPEPNALYDESGVINTELFKSSNKFLVYKENPFPGYEIDMYAGHEHDAIKEKVVQAWSYGSRYLLPFFHKLLKSTTARKELYNYLNQTFENVSYLLSTSIKKKILSICSELLRFLNSYKINRSKYISLSKKDDFINNIGTFESFIFRRIEIDKIPIEELTGFISDFKKLTEKELTNSSADYYFTININDSEIIISDGTNSNYSIFCKQSTNKIDINNLVSIRCIKSDSNNYLIKYDNKEVLYNSKLEEIKRD